MPEDINETLPPAERETLDPPEPPKSAPELEEEQSFASAEEVARQLVEEATVPSQGYGMGHKLGARENWRKALNRCQHSLHGIGGLKAARLRLLLRDLADQFPISEGD